MKLTKHLSPFLLALLALTGYAQTPAQYVGTNIDMDGTPFNAQMLVSNILGGPVTAPGGTMIGQTKTVFTTNGVYSIALEPGSYQVFVNPQAPFNVPATYVYSFIANCTAASGTFAMVSVSSNILTISTTNLPYLSAVDASDMGPNYLGAKLIPGNNITFTTNNPSGNESITIASTGGGGGGSGTATNLAANLNGTNMVLWGATNGASGLPIADIGNLTTLQPASTALTNLSRLPGDIYIAGDGTNYYGWYGDYSSRLTNVDCSALLTTMLNAGKNLKYSIHFTSSPATNEPTSSYSQMRFWFTNTVVLTNGDVIWGEGNPATILAVPTGSLGPIFQIGTASVADGGICRFKSLRLEGGSGAAGDGGILCSNVAEPCFEDCEIGTVRCW